MLALRGARSGLRPQTSRSALTGGWGPPAAGVRRARAGFVVYVLLGALAVLGTLLFALHGFSRQQNVHAHRASYGQLAEGLARSGLTVVLTRFRESFRRSGKLLPLLATLGSTRLAFFVRNRPEVITARFSSAEGESDPFFRELLGPDYRYPLDHMLEQLPGARLDVFLTATAVPLFSGVGVEDPVEKTCDMSFTARATYMEVTRRVRTGLQLKVVNPIAPLASKFTLFVADAVSGYNRLENDAAGQPTGAARPAVLHNTPPEDRADGLSDASLIARRAEPGEVRTAMRHRGHVFLGARSGPVELNLTAGNRDAGEFFHLYSPQRFASGQLYTKLFNPPPYFNAVQGNQVARTRRYDAVDHDQYPYLSSIFFGFYMALENDPNLNESLPDPRSSLLHLYGDVAEPSRTVVWGDVVQDVCKISRIGLESIPRDNPGQVLVAPSAAYGNVPYLPHCPGQKAYEDDLAREQAGADPRYLARIRSSFAPGRPGVLPPFAFAPETYFHEAMFGRTLDPAASSGAGAGAGAGPAGYATVMSRVERFPYVEMADAMLYPEYFPPTATGGEPAATVLELPYSAYREARDVQLPFTDSLHRAMGQNLYYQGDPARFFEPVGTAPSPAERILRSRILREVTDQAEFFALYTVPGTNELIVNDCVRVLEGGLTLSGQTYRGAGLVVLESGGIASGGIRAAAPLPGELPPVLTIATLAGDVTLAGGAVHEALFLAPRGAVRVGGPGAATVAGGIAAATLPADGLGEGLSIQYLSHHDPTRGDDPVRGRYHDYYVVALGHVPVGVERVP
jgi:hypothetical protein